MKAAYWSFLLTTALLCGCGQKGDGRSSAPGQPTDSVIRLPDGTLVSREDLKKNQGFVMARPPSPGTVPQLPVDTFILSIEDRSRPLPVSEPSGPTKPLVPSPAQSEIKVTVALLRYPSAQGEGVKKPLLLCVGAGEKFDQMTFIDGHMELDRKTLITFVVKPVQKKGTGERFFRWRIEIGNETKPSAKTVEADHDYPLLKDQKLADVLAFNVAQSGLYKIGTPVQLGSVRLDADQPIWLHVRWPDGDQKPNLRDTPKDRPRP
jgi:hypothetical protein